MRPAFIAAVGGRVDPTLVKFSSLTSAAESGNGSTGYIYTASAASFVSHVGNANLSVPASTDGAVSATIPTGAQQPVLGLDDVNTAQTFTSYQFGMYPDPTGGLNYYRIVAAGIGNVTPNAYPNFTRVIGDTMRIKRVGTESVAEVYRPSLGFWIPIHKFATTPSTQQYPQSCMGFSGDAIQMGSLLSGSIQARWSAAAVNMAFDGNSLIRGQGATLAAYNLVNAISRRAPVLGSGATLTNLGVDGQTLRMMNGLDAGSSADVDAAWAVGKTNVLVIWEGTNSLFFGRAPAQAMSELTDYIAARQAAHTWNHVAVLTVLPREQAPNAGGTVADMNSAIDSFNTLLRAGYLAAGATHLVEMRGTGSPWNFNTYTTADFDAAQAYYFETTGRIHCSDLGYSKASAIVSDALSLISA